MERWAANTLRTLGIILTSGFVLITSLILLLFSICASQGGIGGSKHPEQVFPYFAAALSVLVLGIVLVVRLSRDIFRSNLLAEPAEAGVNAGVLPPSDHAPSHLSLPLHLSPLGRAAIHRLVIALGAQIALSAFAWILGQLHYWTAPPSFTPHNWTLLLLAPFILYHVPYAILIYALLKRPTRLTFTYSIAVPAVLILQSLFSLSIVGFYYVNEPMGLVLLVLPWLIHIVILVLAYQAIQQVGLHPVPSSIIVAAILMFFFFSSIHIITPLLYRFT